MEERAIRAFRRTMSLAGVALAGLVLPGPALAGGEKLWKTSFKKAFERAKRENKPILLKFTADW